MYLRSLTLRDFAGVSSAAFPLFEPGLNVIVGDNEAGKSTLLTALRAAFFQKHRAGGEAARSLAPYGRQVRPEVEIAFSVGGREYTLRKAFLQKPEAELSWDGGRLSGDAVEERLAELLRFSHSSSRKGEFVGAFGLLWVEQGRSTHGLDLGAGRDAVTASLEGEVSQVLGGERGRGMLLATKALQDRFFTETLRPVKGSPLKEAEDRLAELRDLLAAKQDAFREYEAKLARLSARRDALRGYERDDALAKATTALADAERRVRETADLQRAFHDAERDLSHATERLGSAAERLQRREQMRTEMEAAAAQAAKASETRDDLLNAREREAGDLARLETEFSRARAATREAESLLQAANAKAGRDRLVAESDHLRKRLEEAQTVAGDLVASERAAASISIEAADIKAIEDAERERRDAEIRLSASSPTIRFDPSAGMKVMDGQGSPVEPGQLTRVTARTVFELEGFGSVTVEPGGDAATLQHRFERTSEDLRSLLVRLSVESADEARRLIRERDEHRSETKALKAKLQGVLPEGFDAAARRLAEYDHRLETFGAVASSTVLDPDAAQAEWQRARTREEAAGLALDGARKGNAEFAARLASMEAEAAHRAREHTRLTAELSEAEARRATTALAEDVAAAELQRSAAALWLAQRRQALEIADAETAGRTLQAKNRALDEIRKTMAGLQDEIARLQGELGAVGATSLELDLVRLQEDVAALEARRRRLALEADASRLLHQTLTEAQREARESWLGPIKAQVAPYMKLIHPDSDVTLDDATLEITGLRRRGVDEEFRRLSAGAREQVAVVTRLALADVLKKGGHPAAVILDDALVNTDEKRLERMHMVLQKAAEDLQIIVLTCRERDFRELGAPIFRL